ncbi:MAG: hypothetical protein JGK21_31210, partial [Microcoleus sp. PH2017_22_RUC_O_B]|uniref:hypothetical protein n=1 Tax=unclassified Microcoleus TaxID=2642155 RepID=UPI001E123B77
VRLTLHNFSPKAFGFQVFTTDKKIRPTSAECGLKSERPYEEMNITGVTGLTEVEKATIKALGAVENRS